MANAWIQALKQWRAKTGHKGLAPKKGSAQYKEVMKIMDGLKKRGSVKKKKH
jgi:hypothetical protein